VIVVLCFHRDDDDDDDDDGGRSEVSSVSQNSYDPLHPNFQDKDGEIGSLSSGRAADDQPSDVVLITHRPIPDSGESHHSCSAQIVPVLPWFSTRHLCCSAFQTYILVSDFSLLRLLT